MSVISVLPYGATLDHWWEALRGEPGRLRFMACKMVEVVAFCGIWPRARVSRGHTQPPVWQPPPSRPDNVVPDPARVVVVVPARIQNEAEAKRLDALLAALARQTRVGHVVVVDDASPAWPRTPGVEVLRLQQNVGPAAARNLGCGGPWRLGPMLWLSRMRIAYQHLTGSSSSSQPFSGTAARTRSRAVPGRWIDPGWADTTSATARSTAGGSPRAMGCCTARLAISHCARTWRLTCALTRASPWPQAKTSSSAAASSRQAGESSTVSARSFGMTLATTNSASSAGGRGSGGSFAGTGKGSVCFWRSSRTTHVCSPGRVRSRLTLGQGRSRKELMVR